ncbi:MAG: discoidin domain-containing protein, partial [Chloroflexi bacterium]|nr:discoidin domain-containing protein [Chloroflexota bacterium]
AHIAPPGEDEGLSAVVTPAATPVAPVVEAGPLLRCPACGIANAGTRTFCQSCGARLADTARVTEVSKEQIAAAVAAKARPKTVPVAGVTAAHTEPAKGSSRGIAGWLIVMVLLGLVAGALVVAASVVLRSPGPATGASEAPSTVASAGSSFEAGTTDAPVTSAEPASGGPPAKVEGAALVLTGAAASSVVGDRAKFQPDKAIDGDVKTCWQEGAGTEKGQWIEVSFDTARLEAVVINNGYGASTALYKGNLRPKKVQISVNGGKAIAVTLKDTAKAQRISLGENPGATRLRITIVSVYRSVKTSVAGTPFDDAAISEISVIGTIGG